MGDNLSFEDILAYVSGELSPARAEEVGRLINGSPSGPGLAERLRLVLGTLRADDSVLPGRALVDRAKGLLSRESASPWWMRAASTFASMVFDSQAQTAVAGFRGGTAGRQLAFDSDLGPIDLSVAESAGGGWMIRGQMDARAGDELTEVALLIAGEPEPAARAEPDESGQFRLRTAAPECELRLLVGGRVIALGPVRLE